MKSYHLFTIRPNSWDITANYVFVYEGRKCVERWIFDNGKVVVSAGNKNDISITKRKFILASTQNGQVKQFHDYKKLTEAEAMLMWIDLY